MRRVGSRDTRGSGAQASVIAVALLIGIAAIGVTAVVVVGSVGLTDLQQDVENEQAVTTFTQFDAQASQVALGDSPVRSVDVGDVNSEGEVSAEPTGRMRLVGDNGTEYLNQTMGRLVYRNGDTTVAYQGGGVWRGTGNESRLVSPPEFHYRAGTLTLPLVVTNPGDGSADTGSDIRIAENGSRPSLTPIALEDQVLEVEVTSEHYVAWGTYFQDRIEGVTVTYDHANDTARIRLANIELLGDLAGLVSSGEVNIGTGSPDVDSEVLADSGVTVTGGDLSCDDGNGKGACATQSYPEPTPLDLAIEKLVNSSESDDPDADIDNGPKTLDNGSYYSEGFNVSDGDLTLNISSGNVTLFVDGNIGVDVQNIEVVGGNGTDHYAKVYTTGDFAMAGGNTAVVVDSGNATRFQLYGTSEHHFAMGQSNTEGFTGVVYAPRDVAAAGSNDAVDEYGLTAATPTCGADMCIDAGSGGFNGALIGGPTSIEQSTDFDYDDNVSTLQPQLPAGAAAPPPINFLHVSVNRIDVREVAGSGTVGLSEPTLVAQLTVSEQGSDAYELDATGSGPREYIDEYRWDYDDDGTVDATTNKSRYVVDCNPGVSLNCGSLPDNASVTLVSTEYGTKATETADYD
jgi:hypothetical protein